MYFIRHLLLTNLERLVVDVPLSFLSFHGCCCVFVDMSTEHLQICMKIIGAYVLLCGQQLMMVSTLWTIKYNLIASFIEIKVMAS